MTSNYSANIGDYFKIDDRIYRVIDKVPSTFPGDLLGFYLKDMKSGRVIFYYYSSKGEDIQLLDYRASEILYGRK